MSRNVVLVCLDTARKDLFDEYAAEIRRRGDVSFEGARTASCWSVPSHASMFTGKLPSEHGIHSHNPSFFGLDRAETVIGDLPDHAAIGVSANAYARSEFGFDRLFDSFVDVSRGTVFNEGLDVPAWHDRVDREGIRKYLAFARAVAGHDHPAKSLVNGVANQAHYALPRVGIASPLDDGARTIARSTKRLVEGVGEPFFLFANVMDTHGPRSPRLPYDESIHGLPADWSFGPDDWEVNLADDPERFEAEFRDLRRLMAAEVEYTDRVVARYIDHLRETTARETTVIVTADHGENVGYPAEDGLYKHTSSLSEGLLHVPFVLVNPPAGYDRVEEGLFSHVDLRRLICGLANGETPDVFGESIAAETVGICSSHRGNLSEEDLAYWDRMIRCAYRGTEKVEWDSQGRSRRFEIDPDTPSSQTEIETDVEVPDWALELFSEEITAVKERAVAEDRSDEIEDEISEDAMGRLESLGYA